MADSDIHTYEPSMGHGLKHDPFTAIVGPRPIGWISTKGRNGVPNLAPYSFFNVFNLKPPIIGFSSTSLKDSIRNVMETKEFVWNIVTRPIAERMNETSSHIPSDVSEFSKFGLTPIDSLKVAAPRVRESCVTMECKLVQIVQHRTKEDQALQSWLALGEVVAVHIEKHLIKDGVYQTAAARPILRAGRHCDYVEVTQGAFFEMMRPV